MESTNTTPIQYPAAALWAGHSVSKAFHHPPVKQAADWNSRPMHRRRRKPTERLLTAKEVADWLGVSTRWVLAHAARLNRPMLPRVKLGKAVRFERSDVAEFIRQCTRHEFRYANA